MQTILANDESLQAAIEWQQSHYQKVQSLCQGLLAASLTTVAIAVTGYTVFGGSTLGPPSYEKLSPAEHFGDPATVVIVGFGYFISLLLLGLAFSFFVTSVWYQIEILLERPLPSQRILVGSELSVIKSPSDFSNELGVTLSDNYSELVAKNGKVLDNLQKGFEEAGLRLLTSIAVGLNSILLFDWVYHHEYATIAVYSLVSVIPVWAYIAPIFHNKESENEEIEEYEQSLLEEMLRDKESPLNRFSSIPFLLHESALVFVFKLLLLAVVLTSVVSLVANYLL